MAYRGRSSRRPADNIFVEYSEKTDIIIFQRDSIMNKNSGETVSLFDRISRNKHVEYIDQGEISEWSLNGQVKIVLHSRGIAKPVA